MYATSRPFFGLLIFCAILGLDANLALGRDGRANPNRPNVLLIITDDQGYGDLGVHGNPNIRTPRLDALARESVRFRSFTVMPVCSLTRAGLLTGRYTYRTGVVDTFRGRSLLRTEETTLAEMLAPAGYQCGIFGKWHLGDNAPFRPIDQGFSESLVVKGGGVGQASDPPTGGPGNYNPVLQHNGKPEPTSGFTTDLFTDAAIRFVESAQNRPFFATLAYNAPHVPLEVPTSDQGQVKVGDATSQIYAMMNRVDTNVGRLLDRIEALGLSRSTLVIFLSDNGPEQTRFNGGLRDRKGTVFEGGIRVPCLIRWPGGFSGGHEITPVASHLDLAPTILAACGVTPAESLHLDGQNLLPLLKGETATLPDRKLFFQWHRGDHPEKYRAFAVRSGRYKLVQPLGVAGVANIDPPPFPAPPHFALYDLDQDPAESTDIAARHPQVTTELLHAYETWFADVTADSSRPRPRILVGSDRENPTTLTRQDWRGEGVAKVASQLGGWEVDVVRGGRFDLNLRLDAGTTGKIELEVSGQSQHRDLSGPTDVVRFEGVTLRPGLTTVRAWAQRGAMFTGISQAEIRRVVGQAGEVSLETR